MPSRALTIEPATRQHVAAIVRIEREGGASSLVTLTEGHALEEALARGHWIIVAIDGTDVAGWIWFGLELIGGEQVGRIYRVAVAGPRRRSGAARALLEHARTVFRERSCTRVRATLDAAATDARLFFEAAGFRVDSIEMEQPL